MPWEITDFISHPLWMIVALVLAAVTRAQRRGWWDPSACPVRLTGKTAIVTGANTGTRSITCFSNKLIKSFRKNRRGKNVLSDALYTLGNKVHVVYLRM